MHLQILLIVLNFVNANDKEFNDFHVKIQMIYIMFLKDAMLYF